MPLATLNRLPSSLNCLAVGGAGGILAYLLGIPAPWICGPMIAVAAVALLGVPVAMNTSLRDTIFLLVGFSMGTGVSPETMEKIAVWPASILALLICVLATSFLLAWIFRRGFGWDPATACFSSIPGAFSYLMAVAAQSKAKLGRVAVAQMSRLVVLAALLPSLVALLPGERPEPPELLAGGISAPLWELAAALCFCSLIGYGAKRLNVPAGTLLGSLVASALLHAGGVTEARLPGPLVAFCFVVVGSFIGSRLEGMTIRQIVADARAGLLTVALALLISGLFALAASHFLDLPLALLWLAYAPGGLEVMVIMSLALGLDPAFVAAHHMLRFLALSLAMPLLLKRYLD